MDNMDWELKVRNQAMKQGCASVQMDALKQTLYTLRVVVDTIVHVLYILLQMAMCLFRLLIPTAGETAIGQIVTELYFWFNKLVIIAVDAIKKLADLLFNLMFSLGPLGSALKSIVQFLCWFAQQLLWAWNETGVGLWALLFYYVCLRSFFFFFIYPA